MWIYTHFHPHIFKRQLQMHLGATRPYHEKIPSLFLLPYARTSWSLSSPPSLQLFEYATHTHTYREKSLFRNNTYTYIRIGHWIARHTRVPKGPPDLSPAIFKPLTIKSWEDPYICSCGPSRHLAPVAFYPIVWKIYIFLLFSFRNLWFWTFFRSEFLRGFLLFFRQADLLSF